MSARGTDVYITGEGNVFLFRLMTPEAHGWVDQNVSDDRQMLGNGLAVEARFVADLAAGMEADGLVIIDEEVQLRRPGSQKSNCTSPRCLGTWRGGSRS
jgi:hypothetical protein